MSSSEEAIVYLSKKFKQMGIESLIVGATARDIVAKKYNLPLSERKTNDVDFAVLVESWDQLHRLEKNLVADTHIKKSSEEENHVRFAYKALPFDIVPFGEGIEKQNKVSWPPLYHTIMTVLGYQEALSNCLIVQIENEDINVVCPEMLIALKLIAWNEQSSRTKDIDDIWRSSRLTVDGAES